MIGPSLLPQDQALVLACCSASTREILRELEGLRTTQGIPLERHTIFAVASKA